MKKSIEKTEKELRDIVQDTTTSVNEKYLARTGLQLINYIEYLKIKIHVINNTFNAREEYVKKLEAVCKAAENLQDMDMGSYYSVESDGYEKLLRALDALASIRR